MAGNNLSMLPPEIGRLTALERLQLAGNLFETVPDEIGNLPNLKAIPRPLPPATLTQPPHLCIAVQRMQVALCCV